MSNYQKGLHLEGLSLKELENIELIISDVDDTITTDGKLMPKTLQAMYDANEKGYRIILLSGGSAGWCDIYLRQWPVDMVIAESGAVLLFKDANGEICYFQNPIIQNDYQEKRQSLLKAIGDEYLSTDQYARLYDVAVDLKKTPKEKLREIELYALSTGANTGKSSIHLNIWYGDYNKQKGLKIFMNESGIEDDVLKEKAIYLGDSLNDESVFDFIPLSFGVGQVEEKRDLFTFLPKYIASGHGGEGFFQVLNHLPQRNK